MIVDTSAFVAIIQGEEDAHVFLDALEAAARRGETIAISAATLFELALVIDRLKDPELSREADNLIAAMKPLVADVTRSTADTARAANLRFGKGFHPARLNFGDCFVYALAQETDEPLLFKGNDFAQTDVRRVV